AFTALVSGNLRKLVPYEKAGEEDVRRVFSMHLHVSLYTPLAFGVRKNGAHLAVVGHRRDVANAKYSDWVRGISHGTDHIQVSSSKTPSLSGTHLLIKGSIRCMHAAKGYAWKLESLYEKLLHHGPNSKRYLWEEAYITSGLRLLQHVDTIRVPVS
nr:D-aminoacid aminotransferase-like PLP-dependent enzymes superfamily protein [Tanacetum cinerariifolium]